MKKSTALFAITAAMCSTIVHAQSPGSVRVQPGHFCADNKCVRFSPDLRSVEVHGRVPVSTSYLGLASDPNISLAEYVDLFYLALGQSDRGSDR